MDYHKDKTFLLRLPKDLHISLKKMALDKDITLQDFIVDVLSNYISENSDREKGR
ncbi:MAG: toxin-antitoxin system HicB family antitoxin [Nitrospirae bacterium]|nr:toxin-antitoxin system HicB family antitoxin [Nitrospirota bacterium]